MDESSAVLAGDGGRATVGEEDLRRITADIDRICSDVAQNIFQRRETSDNVRFCRWEGQDSDGRKHQENMSDQRVFPFEGATDGRIRLADTIINERTRTLTMAATKGLARLKGMEGSDDAASARWQTVLKYFIRNKQGSQFRREVEKLAQYQEGDSPGAAVLGVYWQRETALEMRSATADDFGRLLIATYPDRVTPEDLEALASLLADPDRDVETAAMLGRLVPGVSDSRAKRMVRELRETGRTDWPAPYVRVNEPRFVAHRLFEDIFFPVNTVELQRARHIFIREMLSEAELRERVVSAGYDEDWVEETLKHEGESYFERYMTRARERVAGDYTMTVQDTNPYEGLYEVVTEYRRAVNDDGVPGIYVTTFSCFVSDMAARDRELLPYQHGQYPFVWFSAETLGNCLVDTRGVSETVMTHQAMFKLFNDTVGDYTQIATIPPVRTPLNRPSMQIVWGPGAQIPARAGDLEWMRGPQYPAAAQNMQVELQRQVDTYFGRENPAVPNSTVILQQQAMVDRFLASMADAFGMMLQLCVQYLGDDELQRIANFRPGTVPRGRAEVQGRFDIEVSFDIRDMNLEWLKLKAGMIRDMIAPLDTQGTIMRNRLVARMFYSLDPDLSDEVIQPVETANMQEIESERINFSLIAAGVEPAMQAEGQNYPLRLQTIQGIAQRNPQSIEKMTDDSKALLDRRIKHLQFMVSQRENAQTGRLGVS